MDTNNIYGFSLDELDAVADEIFHTLAEQAVTKRLGLLALCRAITLIGDDNDLDLACQMIDEIHAIATAEEAEIEFDDPGAEDPIENEVDPDDR